MHGHSKPTFKRREHQHHFKRKHKISAPDPQENGVKLKKNDIQSPVKVPKYVKIKQQVCR